LVIFILGKTGFGKTSLGVYFGIKAMDNGKESLEIAQSRLSCYSGYNKIKLPNNHLVYSDIYICGSEENNKPSTPHFTTGYRFGLPNPDFETDYYPYGSTIIFDEARKYWSARKSMLTYENGGTHEKTLEAFELSRHNGLDIYIITHLTNHIDINIRSHAHKVIAPIEVIQDEVGERLKFTITKWKCKEFSDIDDYESYLKGDKTIKFEDTEYVYNGDIFECYDSEYFIFKFLQGLRTYKSVKFKPFDGTKKSANLLVELYSNLRIDNNKEKTKRKKVEDNAVQDTRRTNIEYL